MDTESLRKKVKKEFTERFEGEPVIILSPGRVNLIGEHTDYNDGFVLPAAIDKVIVLAIMDNQTNKVRSFSSDMNESIEIDLSKESGKQEFHWANYIKGIIAELRERDIFVKGFDLVFGGNIPIGAGMSSSAALEGGLLLGLKTLFGFELSKSEMARTGQLTEHNHVGVRCGIMDQFINIHGQKGQALKLDCRTLDYEMVPFNREDLSIVLCNSKVSHNLASSEYNVRRTQCEEGVDILKNYDPDIKNLRDVSLELIQEHKNELPTLVYQRCRFVIEENQRVLDGCKDLEQGDITSFGKRMYDSHTGLSKDYEVSCSELDALVEIAKNVPGVIGARMMGGGFGGCTINLVEERKVDVFVQLISTEYKSRTGIDPEIYITKIGRGVYVGE